MIKRKIQAKDLEVGMDFIYRPRKGKYFISRIWNIVRYGERVKIFFNNAGSKHARENRLFYVLINPVYVPEDSKYSSRLEKYFDNLKAYRGGSTICRCGMIIPNRSVWHICD